MQQLNLPSYSFTVKKKGDNTLIFDELRKKYLVLTPEEWVRQHIIKFLIQEKKFPSGLISIEAEINVNNLRRRYDGLVYSRKNSPLLLIECKAPTVEINQKVFDQIFAYNTQVIAPYLLVTNGLRHFLLKREKGGGFKFSKEFPEYDKL
jgi:hypothetical protein